MKRALMVLILVFAAGNLLAGGKSCEASKAKSVHLTGTIASGSNGAMVFRVANSDKSYTVCHKTNAELVKLGANGQTLQIEGKVVSCDETAGEELVIESAKKI